ncbi:MAG: 50S ribosomal protein L11 methyltransferase [Hyphomicrobiaceae bacterium]|nr:50S ribosomal protein L11 methyltransferase [Hyphomicrobiaceae bacterium]
MPQAKLTVPVPDLSTGRAVEAALLDCVACEPLAVTVFEATAPAFQVEAYYEAPPDLALLAGVLAPAGVPASALALVEVPDENWVAVSQAALPPVWAGRFVVHGAHDRHRVGALRHAVEIEAGEAFGTGHNGTTAGCLEALDRLARRRTFARVLDLGCGTALLAIAAARLFPHARVLASDNDPIATAVARDNVALNRARPRLRVLTGAGFAHPALRAGAPFDLILANILPNTLIALAPRIRTRLAPGGTVVLSGILNFQVGQVRAVYAALGFRLERLVKREGWSILTLTRGR